MNADRLLAHFERISDAPNAVDRLRTLVLSLAYAGRLLPTVESPASKWHSSTVGEVAAEIVPGIACSKSHQTPKGHVHLRTHNVATNGRLNFDLVIRVDPKKLALEKSGLRRGDVIFNNTNSQELVGKTCLVDQDYEYAFSNHLTRIRLKETVAPEFFTGYFLLLLRKGFFAALCNRWIGQAGINTTALKAIAFAFPPLAEQHRIVAKVDELMQLCDRLEASQQEREGRRDRLVMASLNRLSQPTEPDEFKKDAGFQLSNLNRLSTKPEHIKEIRKAILNLAVTAKLVPQDESEGTASELLDDIRFRRTTTTPNRSRSTKSPVEVAAAEQPYPLPSSWAWTVFGSLIIHSDSGWSPKTEGFPRSGDEWGVLKVSAVSWDVFQPAENKQLLPGVIPPESTVVRKGDFLISRANTSHLIARCVIVDAAPHNLIMSDKIVRLHLVEECNPHFLKIVNNDAGHARVFYAAKATGTSLSMKNVSRDVIYDLPIPLPPLAEQKRIVAKVDELMLICDQLENQLESQQKGCRQLLEALLHEALEGVG